LTAVSDTVASRIPAIQLELIQLMGELATPKGEESRYARVHPQHISEESVARLDSLVLEMEENDLIKSTGWALPGEGGVFSAAYCDLARTVCRRAERTIVDLVGTPHEVPNPDVIKFLNRLSDVLWLMARVETKIVQAQADEGSEVRTDTGTVLRYGQ
jgi:cob(I)alamin adenosyltransferase